MQALVHCIGARMAKLATDRTPNVAYGVDRNAHRIASGDDRSGRTAAGQSRSIARTAVAPYDGPGGFWPKTSGKANGGLIHK